MKKNQWLYWIKLLAGLALLVFLYQKISNHESILTALYQTNWWNVVWCGLLLIPNLLLAQVKWYYLVHKRFAGVTWNAVFGSLLFGYTLGLITPGRLGELGRGLFFRNHDRLLITGLNVLDKAANQVVTVTLGYAALTAMIFSGHLWTVAGSRPYIVAGAALVVTLWVIILFPGLLRSLLHGIRERLAADSKAASLLSALDGFRIRDSAIILGLTLLWSLVIVFQYHVLVRAFTPVSFGDSFQAVTAMLLVKTMLPFTFGDLGIRESVAVYFYSFFAVSQAAVFNASLLVFSINFLFPALAGAYFVLQMRGIQQSGGRPAPDPVVEGSETG